MVDEHPSQYNNVNVLVFLVPRFYQTFQYYTAVGHTTHQMHVLEGFLSLSRHTGTTLLQFGTVQKLEKGYEPLI